jgi:hypothetical protein
MPAPSKPIRRYVARTLVAGKRIGKDGQYVGIPDMYKDYAISVFYNGKEIALIADWGKAETYRHQPDKLKGNGTFTLGYFKVEV